MSTKLQIKREPGDIYDYTAGKNKIVVYQKTHLLTGHLLDVVFLKAYKLYRRKNRSRNSNERQICFLKTISSRSYTILSRR